MMTNYGIRPLGAIAAFVVAGAACGPKAATGGRIDASLAKYIAPDAKAVADVQLANLRATPFFARHRNYLAKLIPLGDSTGQVLLTWNGKSLLLADKQAATGKITLGGNPLAVQRAEAAAKSGTGKLPNELAEALAGLAASDQIRVLDRGLPFEGVRLPSQWASLLANFHGHIRRAAAGLNVGSGLSLRSRIDCFSVQGALRVEVALRAGIGYGRLSASDKNPVQAQALAALTVRRDDTAVFVEGDFPPELSDALLEWTLRQARH